MALFHGELLSIEKMVKKMHILTQWRSLPSPLALAVDHGVIGRQVLAKHTHLGSCCSALATSGFQCYSISCFQILYLCRCMCYYSLWLQPLWKILVNWDDYSQHMGNMFQATNQCIYIYIPTLSYLQKTRNHSLILIVHGGSLFPP